MAPFDPDKPLGPDYAVMRDGSVALFHRRETLAEYVEWLFAHGYRVIELDATKWTTRADFHRDISTALDFPPYYGNNLDAFNDSLHDVTGAGDLVLVFTGYDVFARHEPKAAQTVLDIIATQARQAMLFGHRLMCLVQSDDPELAFDVVGGTPVVWH